MEFPSFKNIFISNLIEILFNPIKSIFPHCYTLLDIEMIFFIFNGFIKNMKDKECNLDSFNTMSWNKQAIMFSKSIKIKEFIQQ